jgi:PAS domain S-box-containing protein
MIGPFSQGAKVTHDVIDLSNCELEPIHLIGSIQPHGFLLAIRENDLTIQHVSANTEVLLGRPYHGLIGKRLEELVGDGSCRQIADACRSNNLEAISPLTINVVDAPSVKIFQATLHRSDGQVILEAEPFSSAANESTSLAHELTSAFPELFSAAEIPDLLAATAREVQRITDFDRVLIYRFDEKWDGTVVAEHRRDFMCSYMNQKFPASDIPKQARELYVKNRIRMLVDVHAVPAPIMPQLDTKTNSPLDLSFSILRSMSQFHVEYLKNMDVSASTSISVIKDGELWALIVCHHKQAKLVEYKIRTILRFLAQLLSMLVSRMEHAQHMQYQLSLKNVQDLLRRNLSQETNLVDGLTHSSSQVLEAVAARGFALFSADTLVTAGLTPPANALSRLHEWLKVTADSTIVISHRLSTVFPEAMSFADVASGLLAVPISGSGHWLVWFRPEVIREIQWAGNPEKPVLLDAARVQIHPRQSFELWKEKVVATSEPWKQSEIASAIEVENIVREFVLESQLRESTNENRKLAQVVQYSTDAIVGLTNQAIIISWNNGAERLYGWPAQEAIGHEFSILLSPEKADEGLTLINSLQLQGRIENFETMHKRKDGRPVYVSQSWSEIYDTQSGLSAISVSGRDISEKKEAEKRVSEFYSMVSHELRTPLTSIRAALGLMEGGVTGKLPAKAEHLVEIARTESDRLIRLINDILDIRKIEAGKLDLKISAWQARELVDTTIEALAPMAEANHVRIKRVGDFTGKIRCDRDRFIQVLTNLLSNSIKFSPADSEVVVTTKRESHVAIKFLISDQGPGIAAAQMDKLFGKFQQLDSSDSRQKGGTGLGLAISKEIVEGHGGKIGLESTVGKGSTFWFQFPLAEVPLGDESVEPAVLPTTHKVLIVEDDQSLSTVLKETLTSQGFAVIRTGTLAEAQKALSEVIPDVILLDIRLPDGNGLDFTDKLRQKAETQNIPIVVLTGSAPHKVSFGKPMIVDWITKPCDEKRLETAMKLAVQRSQATVTVLVVEDDAATQELIADGMKNLGLDAQHVPSGASAIHYLRSSNPDLTVIDLGIPPSNEPGFVPIGRQEKERAAPLLIYSKRDLTMEDKESLTTGLTKHLTKTPTGEVEFALSVRELIDELLT